MPILIRSYQTSDLPQLIDLTYKLQQFFYEIDTSTEVLPLSDHQSAERYLLKAIEDVERMSGVLLVAEVDAEVKGYLQGGIVDPANDTFHSLTRQPGKQGWIGLLIVDEEARGQGLGKALVEKAKEYFVASGCTSMRLKVSSDNTTALEWYRRLGLVKHDLEMAMRLE